MTQKTIVHRQQASKDQPKQTSFYVLHLVCFVYYIELTFLLLKLGGLVQGFAAYIYIYKVKQWTCWNTRKACRSCSSSSFMTLFPRPADDVERSQLPQDFFSGTATSLWLYLLKSEEINYPKSLIRLGEMWIMWLLIEGYILNYG